MSTRSRTGFPIARRSFTKRSRGVAMVEFTIVLPVILFMILGVTELSRVMIRYNALTKAVRDGARHASALALLGTTGTVMIDQALTDAVRNVVVYGNVAGTGTPVLEGLAAGQVTLSAVGAEEIRVDVTYPYVPLLGNSIPSFGTGSDLSAAFTMQASVNMRAL
ncbi:MAG: TadE/TadG family type IV pilus assembly protein [Gammaproteobacteria bacterium]